MRLLLFPLLLLWFSSAFASHKVFLLHGYASPSLLMTPINYSLLNARFKTQNFRYNSMSVDLDSLGKQLYLELKKANVDSVSFVTHSMGALVVRSMLQYSKKDAQFPYIYRVVMIAPPNRGAEIADFFSSFPSLRPFLGPNVEHMRTDSTSYANRLPFPERAEVGVIIGIKGDEEGYNEYISGDNDGLLTPSRTCLGMEKDVVILKKSHTMLTQTAKTRKLIIEFLKNGFFESKEENIGNRISFNK